MATRQNKKRKGRNNVLNRERTVTTLTEAESVFLSPTTTTTTQTTSDETTSPIMSSPYSISSSPNISPNFQHVGPVGGYAPYQQYYALPTGSSFPPQPPQQPFFSPPSHMNGNGTGTNNNNSISSNTSGGPSDFDMLERMKDNIKKNTPLDPNSSSQTQTDLEILQKLKEEIKNNQHHIYKPVPQPAALAKLYLGPRSSGQTQTDAVPPNPNTASGGDLRRTRTLERDGRDRAASFRASDVNGRYDSGAKDSAVDVDRSVASATLPSDTPGGSALHHRRNDSSPSKPLNGRPSLETGRAGDSVALASDAKDDAAAPHSTRDRDSNWPQRRGSFNDNGKPPFKNDGDSGDQGGNYNSRYNNSNNNYRGDYNSRGRDQRSYDNRGKDRDRDRGSRERDRDNDHDRDRDRNNRRPDFGGNSRGGRFNNDNSSNHRDFDRDRRIDDKNRPYDNRDSGRPYDQQRHYETRYPPSGDGGVKRDDSKSSVMSTAPSGPSNDLPPPRVDEPSRDRDRLAPPPSSDLRETKPLAQDRSFDSSSSRVTAPIDGRRPPPFDDRRPARGNSPGYRGGPSTTNDDRRPAGGNGPPSIDRDRSYRPPPPDDRRPPIDDRDRRPPHGQTGDRQVRPPPLNDRRPYPPREPTPPPLSAISTADRNSKLGSSDDIRAPPARPADDRGLPPLASQPPRGPMAAEDRRPPISAPGEPDRQVRPPGTGDDPRWSSINDDRSARTTGPPHTNMDRDRERSIPGRPNFPPNRDPGGRPEVHSVPITRTPSLQERISAAPIPAVSLSKAEDKFIRPPLPAASEERTKPPVLPAPVPRDAEKAPVKGSPVVTQLDAKPSVVILPEVQPVAKSSSDIPAGPSFSRPQGFIPFEQQPAIPRGRSVDRNDRNDHDRPDGDRGRLPPGGPAPPPLSSNNRNPPSGNTFNRAPSVARGEDNRNFKPRAGTVSPSRRQGFGSGYRPPPHDYNRPSLSLSAKSRSRSRSLSLSLSTSQLRDSQVSS